MEGEPDAVVPRPARTALGSSLLRLGLAALGVVAVGLVAGIAFGRADPGRAARLLVADLVVEEPVGSATLPPAPSSGEVAPDATVACGVVTTLDLADQIATLHAGLVVVQYRDPADGPRLAAWAARRGDVVVVATPALDVPVVATAWTRRLRLDGVNEELLGAFATGHAHGLGTSREGCGG